MLNNKRPLKTGLDRLAANDSAATAPLTGRRVGLAAHPATVTGGLRHALDVLVAGHRAGHWKVSCLFGPQHGWLGDTQDNMIEWEGGAGPDGLPLFSLYGQHREPTDDMLANLDVIVVDFQDVGCRVYTFIQTLFLIMKAAQRNEKNVVVLDRPNPIGPTVEGGLLHPDFATFVGFTPIPLRHGATMGELARYYQKSFFPNCPLTVVDCSPNTDGDHYFDDFDLPWVMPSPNMPTLETAVVYPGTVLFEATNVSEGRGTTRPFELIGAPGVSGPKLAEQMDGYGIDGASFRPLVFAPTFHKFAEQQCGGIQIHVTQRTTFRPVLCGMALILAFKTLWPGFEWLPPPYEYEYEKMPIDILAGDDQFRGLIDKQAPFDELKGWLDDVTPLNWRPPA